MTDTLSSDSRRLRISDPDLLAFINIAKEKLDEVIAFGKDFDAKNEELRSISSQLYQKANYVLGFGKWAHLDALTGTYLPTAESEKPLYVVHNPDVREKTELPDVEVETSEVGIAIANSVCNLDNLTETTQQIEEKNEEMCNDAEKGLNQISKNADEQEQTGIEAVDQEQVA